EVVVAAGAVGADRQVDDVVHESVAAFAAVELDEPDPVGGVGPRAVGAYVLNDDGRAAREDVDAGRRVVGPQDQGGAAEAERRQRHDLTRLEALEDWAPRLGTPGSGLLAKHGIGPGLRVVMGCV